MKKIIFILFLSLSLIQTQAQQCDLINAGDDVTVDCANNCTTLTATYSAGINATTETYSINADVPCPIPPTGAITPTSISLDDRWSSAISLPFDFYFFGTSYNQIIIGDNGVVSFDLNNSSPIQQPNGSCEWKFTDALPSTNLFKNTIFGAYHDLYIQAGGRIEYYVSGTAPLRKFVVSFNNIAQYHCNSLHTTQRIVLYETSNVIDVQIDRKDTCNSWNNGNAVVGIQNEARDVAVVPPGRNTGPWTVPSSAPELWRFVPTANQSTITFDTIWYNDATNALVGTSDSVNVCITEDTTFRVEASYVDPNGNTVVLTNRVTVFFNDTLGNVDLGPDTNECENVPYVLDATAANATSYEWQKNGVVIPGETGPTYNVTETGTYTATAFLGVCSESDDVYIEILSPVMIMPSPTFYGELDVNANGGLPPYQYSLDGSTYQDSNHFEGLPDDDYTAYVKDSNGCVYTSLPIHVTNLKFPHFLTPNGDGYNDTWRIENAENTPNATIYIYNRFGKVLKRMHTKSNESWNGTFNGYPMPASDYWFSLTLPSGKLYKGHFSIKR